MDYVESVGKKTEICRCRCVLIAVARSWYRSYRVSFVQLTSFLLFYDVDMISLMSFDAQATTE